MPPARSESMAEHAMLSAKAPTRSRRMTQSPPEPELGAMDTAAKSTAKRALDRAQAAAANRGSVSRGSLRGECVIFVMPHHTMREATNIAGRRPSQSFQAARRGNGSRLACWMQEPAGSGSFLWKAGVDRKLGGQKGCAASGNVQQWGSQGGYSKPARKQEKR